MLSKISVASRLSIGFGFILLILVAVTTAAILKVRVIDEALTANSEQHAPVQRAAINFRGSVHERAIAIRDLVLAASASDREKALRRIEELAAFYARSEEQLKASLSEPSAAWQQRPMYETIRAAESQAVATTQHLIKLVSTSPPAAPEARDFLWSQAKPQYDQWLAAINGLIDFEEERLRAEEQVARTQASSFVGVMLTALVLAILVSVVAAWRVSRSLLRQLGAEPNGLALAARKVADGDLRAVADLEQSREGSVAFSLAAMGQTRRHWQ
jgi:methyl-accepting chemotaxis protein